MLLKNLIQFLSLLVVKVEVLALGDCFGAHHLGDSRPISAILEQTYESKRRNILTLLTWKQEQNYE